METWTMAGTTSTILFPVTACPRAGWSRSQTRRQGRRDRRPATSGSNTAPPSRPVPDLDRGNARARQRADQRLRGHPGPGIEEDVRETDEDVPGAWIP